MGVKCLAQEHNTVPRPGLEPGPFDPESSALTIRPPRLPLPLSGTVIKPLTFVGYDMIITNSYPTLARGILLKNNSVLSLLNNEMSLRGLLDSC